MTTCALCHVDQESQLNGWCLLTIGAKGESSPSIMFFLLRNKIPRGFYYVGGIPPPLTSILILFFC